MQCMLFQLVISFLLLHGAKDLLSPGMLNNSSGHKMASYSVAKTA